MLVFIRNLKNESQNKKIFLKQSTVIIYLKHLALGKTRRAKYS